MQAEVSKYERRRHENTLYRICDTPSLKQAIHTTKGSSPGKAPQPKPQSNNYNEGCVTVKASVVLWEHTSHVIANNLSVSSPVLNPQHSCHKHSKQV